MIFPKTAGACMIAMPIVLTSLAAWLYKSKRPKMLKFYLKMAGSPYMRKFYSLVCLLVLIAFNVFYINSVGANTPILLAAIFSAFMFSYKKMTKMFLYLQSRIMICVYFSIMLFIMVFPTWWPISMCFFIIFLASAFFPSRKLIDECSENDTRIAYYSKHPGELVKCYFRTERGWENQTRPTEDEKREAEEKANKEEVKESSAKEDEPTNDPVNNEETHD